MLLNKKLAIIGNPNVGKTTVFNALTGLHQRVGNWPGVTVSKHSGNIDLGNHLSVELVDLPGIYGLNATSIDEKIATSYLKSEQTKDSPDAILLVLDMNCLERSLYLALQVLELKIPTIIVPTMLDIAEKNGYEFDFKKLESLLGVPVLSSKADIKPYLAGVYSGKISLRNDFKALPLSESDALNVATNRWNIASNIRSQAMSIKGLSTNKMFTTHLDRILLNNFLGIPLMALIFYAVFNITFMLSDPLVGYVEEAFALLGEYLNTLASSYNAPEIILSFIENVLINGFGTVLSFFPTIFVLFFFFSALEDSGYLSRCVFLLDRVLSKFGLHGHGLLPMILGFGCSVPAFMSSRSLKNERDRMMTMFMVPFMSCSAKLPVYVLFADLFFPSNAGNIVFSLYVLGILFGLLVIKLQSILMRNQEQSWLVMELPVYHLPGFRSASIHGFNRAKSFIQRAYTTILFGVSAIWVLAFFPLGAEYASIDSWLGQVGSSLAPIFSPAGYGVWQAVVALATGLLAKEVVIGTLGGILGENLEVALSTLFTPLSAYAFLVMVLLYSPCITALATFYKETNLRWTLVHFFFSNLTAWCVSVLVFQLGSLIV